MNKKQVLPIGIVLLVLVAGAFLLFGAPAQSDAPLKVGYTPIASQLPLYVAIEEGYFAEEGLEIELIKFESPNQVNDALMQGQLDVTCPGMALGIFAMADYKNPGKIKVYNITGGTGYAPGDTGYTSPMATVLVHKDSTITNPAELKGKKFGIFGGTIQWVVLAKGYLDYHGLTAYEDVEIVELTPAMQVPALAAKQIDALYALEPMNTVAMTQDVGKIIDKIPLESSVDGAAWIGAGAVNLAYASKHPEKVEKYLRAIKRGIDFVENHPEQAVQYLPKYTPLPEALAQKVPVLDYRTCDEIGARELAGMQKFFDLFTKYGVVEGDIDAKEVLYC